MITESTIALLQTGYNAALDFKVPVGKQALGEVVERGEDKRDVPTRGNAFQQSEAETGPAQLREPRHGDGRQSG